MKKTLLLLFTLMALKMVAQTYSGPESVEFDYVNNRWFVANKGNQTIITRNSTTGALSAFASGLGSGPHGLEIVNDTLYACSGKNLKAFNINTGAPVFNINLTTAPNAFLNGITHDNSGNLYITDYSDNKIYRFNTNTRQRNVFVGTGLSNPNGIIYDAANNRCVFLQWSSNIIRSLNLADSSVTTLVASGLSSNDGIVRDASGNYYVSSWTGNKVTRYTNTFTTPTTVITGLSSPADIFYNVLTDTLAVPNSPNAGGYVSFHYMGSATGANCDELCLEQGFNLMPNPAQENVVLYITALNTGQAAVSVYTMQGALVFRQENIGIQKGENKIDLNTNLLAKGTYIVEYTTANGKWSKQLVMEK
jgi:Secretion system C-terminal sorting domain/SMP-30/Gluconolactonase/LRE-like region